jgi:hypothetical protein
MVSTTGTSRAPHMRPPRARRTPCPKSHMARTPQPHAYAEYDAGGTVDIETDWVNPIAPPPAPISKKSSSEKGKLKSRTKKAVPVPSVQHPFPVSAEDGAPRPVSPLQQERDKKRPRNVTVSPRHRDGSGQRMHTACAQWRMDAEQRCARCAHRGMSSARAACSPFRSSFFFAVFCFLLRNTLPPLYPLSPSTPYRMSLPSLVCSIPSYIL